MKNIFFLIILLLITFSEQALAQFEGKHFISGSAGINFSNSNPPGSSSSNTYGYNFNVDLGTFKTNTRASGWSLSNSLGGKKQQYPLLENNSYTVVDKSGITSVGIKAGRFWQYYKHFNDKIGIYGGPNIGFGYTNATDYNQDSNIQYLIKTKNNSYEISLGLSAGLYYKFSEKWWVTASLAFSDPVSISYTFASTTYSNVSDENKARQLNYSLTPSFTFPSVGFGVRYFYNRQVKFIRRVNYL